MAEGLLKHTTVTESSNSSSCSGTRRLYYIIRSGSRHEGANDFLSFLCVFMFMTIDH